MLDVQPVKALTVEELQMILGITIDMPELCSKSLIAFDVDTAPSSGSVWEMRSELQRAEDDLRRDYTHLLRKVSNIYRDVISLLRDMGGIILVIDTSHTLVISRLSQR